MAEIKNREGKTLKADYNFIAVSGVVTKDSQRQTYHGKDCIRFSIANNQLKKDEEFYAQDPTYFTCEAWGLNLHTIPKGTRVDVQGKHVTNKWVGSDGQAHSNFILKVSGIRIKPWQEDPYICGKWVDLSNSHTTTVNVINNNSDNNTDSEFKENEDIPF